MSTNAALHKSLKALQQATAKLNLDEAMALIDNAVADPLNADFIPHFEVHKANVLWGAGKRHEAVDVLENCTNNYDHIDSAHYFAGEYLLQLGHFAHALRHLSRCITSDSDDSWFEDSAYLLRAYCAAKLGEFEMARQDLLRVGDDDPIGWIEANPVISRPSIRRIIDSGS